MSRPPSATERDALDLTEEAVRLLRVRPALLLPYYVGTIPFVVGLLYFWSDMTHGAHAHGRAAESALLMSLAFVWMKTWQSVFARGVHAALGLGAAPPLSFTLWVRTATIQAPVQALGFFLLPVCLILTVPFGWVYAFMQNHTLTGSGGATLREAVRRAREQAMLWPGQNHRFLAIMLLFGLVVFINAGVVLAFLPALLKMFIGTHTEFTRSYYSLANTTFLLAAAGLTHLAMDPVIKTFYVIRCHLGDSLATGEDILAGVRSLPPAARRLATLSSMLFILALPSLLVGQDSKNDSDAVSWARPGVPSLTVGDFNAAADEVLDQREFAWRLPRQKAPEERGLIEEFITGVFNALARWIGNTFKYLGKLIQWFLDRWKVSPDLSGPASATSQVFRILVYGFLVTAALIMIIWLIRVWRRRPVRPVAAPPAPRPPLPDLSEDQVDASQLPVSEWLAMAHDLMREGKTRLALRAVYLATLAGLGERDWIRPARHKSNMDYRSELDRRARALPELSETFARHIGDFERVWYGNHDLPEDGLAGFERDYERIISLATR